VLGGLAPTVGDDAQFSYHQLTRLAQPVLELARRTVLPAMNFGLAAFERIADPAYHLYVRVNGGADSEVMVDPDVKSMFLNDLLGAEAIRAPIHDLALFGRHWGFELADIKVPVFIWHGDADHVVPYGQGQHLARTIGSASLTTVPDLGHFAGFTQAEVVLDALRSSIADARG
jgi:pimeloyl-ACP methyl ester carboxylesterase